MAKIKKKTALIYAASFAGTALVLCLLVFVVFKNMFYGIYSSRGDAKFEAGEYAQAVKDYAAAKRWNPKKQHAYLALADSYLALEDYDSAGEVIDEAVKKRIVTEQTGLEQLYLKRIAIYSAAGNLEDAVGYIDGVNDDYIRRKLQEVRPGDISYTPTQGSYDKTQKMSITVREGETVYYTTDGTYPTKFSNVYVEPINIGNGTTSVTAVAVNSDGLVSPMLSVTYSITNENETVVFNDPKIEKMVRISLSKPNGVVRVKELAGVTRLSNEGVAGKVKTLSDLDMMPNLEMLALDGESELLSVSQLSGKAKLRELYLSDCGLSDSDTDALGGLAALETLDLSNNDISSITFLSKVTTLKNVYLSRNRIGDISALSSSKSLALVDASQNRISAIPDFEAGGVLETLMLGGNYISDISTVHRLTSLKYLDLSRNLIKNGKNLSALTKLQTLILSSNQIANFDFIKQLTGLTALDVDDTSFVSAGVLSGLKLTSFSANNTGISSIEPLSQSSGLISLEIAETNVTDLAPIKDMSKLDYLDISRCKIDDLTVLSGLPGLFTLRALEVDLTGIQFANPEITVVTQ